MNMCGRCSIWKQVDADSFVWGISLPKQAQVVWLHMFSADSEATYTYFNLIFKFLHAK